MPFTLGTLAFVLAVASLVVALRTRADAGQKRRRLLLSTGLHSVVTLSATTQNVLSIAGIVLVLTMVIFFRPFLAPPR
jgi:hypothetical protein